MTTIFTKSSKLFLFALSILFLASSCMKESEPVEETPYFYFSFFNAFSGSDEAQLYYNGSSTGTVEYKYYSNGSSTTSSLFTFPEPGNSTFRFLNPSNSAVIIDDTEIETEKDSVYSLFLYGASTPGKLLYFNNQALSDESTNPRIRFVNLASGVGNVDLFFGDEKIDELSNREIEAQSTASEHQKFIISPKAAATTSIIVKDADGEELYKFENYGGFTNGGYYTIVFYGEATAADNSAKALGILVQQL